jgi:hypothetical protein
MNTETWVNKTTLLIYSWRVLVLSFTEFESIKLRITEGIIHVRAAPRLNIICHVDDVFT